MATSARRAAKSKNKKGDPIELKAKVLAVLSDHQHGIFVACADGLARSVNLDVGTRALVSDASVLGSHVKYKIPDTASVS